MFKIAGFFFIRSKLAPKTCLRRTIIIEIYIDKKCLLLGNDAAQTSSNEVKDPVPEAPPVPETPPPTPRNPGTSRASFFPNSDHSYFAQTEKSPEIPISLENLHDVEMDPSPDGSGIVAGNTIILSKYYQPRTLIILAPTNRKALPKNLQEIQNVTAIGVKTKLKRIET